MADGAPSRTDGFQNRVAIVFGLALLALLAVALHHVLLLAFAAIVIAVGLRAFAKAIERIAPIGRKLSLAASALIVIGVIAGALWLLGAQISGQIAQAVDILPAAWNEFRGRLAEDRLGAVFADGLEQIVDEANSLQLGQFAPRLGSFSMALAGGVLEFIIVLIAAAFLSVTPKLYRDGLIMLAPQKRRRRFGEALDASGEALAKWLGGTLLSMALLTIAVSLGLWAFGVPAPLALGLFTGLAQFVPVIGPIVAAVPGILLALTISPETGLWVALFYFVASQFDTAVVYPLIQQRAVALPPVLTLFAVIAAGILFGPLGVLLATPLLVVICVFVVVFYVRGVLGDQDAPVLGA
jgi:predicted PurR-regulated permease PerM